MTYLTPEAAAERLCPLARTFAEPKATTGCRGPDCMLWRWHPISAADPRFVTAVQKEIDRLAEGAKDVQRALLHKSAVATVSADLRGHGVPTEPERGYCGAGGPA